MFHDRVDAGTQLLAALPPLDAASTVIVALPRGGVPVAEVIANALNLPLDIVLVRKVGMPGQPELALAAVTDGDAPRISVNEDVARVAGLSEAQIWDLADGPLREIERRRDLYRGGRDALPVRGRTVVVVDDGIATGATMRASLRLLRALAPERLIAAVPVAPTEAVADLAAEADDVICLETPRPFHAVGAHYQSFEQVPDALVTETLNRNRAAHDTSG